MCIDAIPRQKVDCATPISRDNTPQNVLAPEGETNEHYVLTPKPGITSYQSALWTKTNSICYQPKHLHFTRSWNSFQCWINNFLESYFIHEIDWYYTEAFRKSHVERFFSYLWTTSNWFLFTSSNRNRFYPHNVLRVCLYDHFLNIAPLFAPDWFTDAFNALFGVPCYIRTHCGIYFSNFLFVQNVFIFLLKFS